ncbi:MAG TPA: Rieske 2Fe-2S domain-containing protein [Nitrososphaerales archaeon]|nr:Rieske 2Fe-2S domain-containing protein [Nitrososphaerales archaeon]
MPSRRGKKRKGRLYPLGRASQIFPSSSELSAYIVEVNGKRVGVYRFGAKYFAYENQCPHEGGPVAEGKVVGHYECKLSEGPVKRDIASEGFSEESMDIVCPWHGIQFDLQTGECRGSQRLKLTPYEVVQDGEMIKLKLYG